MNLAQVFGALMRASGWYDGAPLLPVDRRYLEKGPAPATGPAAAGARVAGVGELIRSALKDQKPLLCREIAARIDDPRVDAYKIQTNIGHVTGLKRSGPRGQYRYCLEEQ